MEAAPTLNAEPAVSSLGRLDEPADPGLLRMLFQQQPDGVFVMEMNGKFVEANPAACQMAGCTRRDLIGLRPWDFVTGASRHEIQDWMRCLPRGEPATRTLACRSRQGKQVMVEAKVVRLDDDRFLISCREMAGADGPMVSASKLQGLSGAGPARRLRLYRRRLLQLQWHNQTLVESEQRLRLAIELGRVGLWVWNATDTTHPGHWSDRLKEIFGLPLDAEVTHDMFLKCVHPDDRTLVDAAVRAAIGGHEGGRYSTEYRSLHPEHGTVGWVLARGQAFFAEDGSVLRFIGTVVDITERKRVEEALADLNRELELHVTARTAELEQANQSLLQEIAERQRAESALQQSKDNLRLVIDTIPGLVWSSLPDGNIEYLNRRWLDYTGLTLEKAAGWGWQQAVHPDDLHGLVAYWTSLLQAGTSGETEARLRRHDGEYRWFLFRGVPLYDEAGRLIKWYGTNTDVEERRSSERLARGQAEALSQTLTALSQEPDSENLLKHVLNTIGDCLGAHSIAVWEMNEASGSVELVANCEGGHVELSAPETSPPELKLPLGRMAHPVWEEFFARGAHCLAGELGPGGSARVRVLDGTDSPWHDWIAPPVASPAVPALLDRLSAAGVAATLSVPLFVAGRVTGFLSIRFQRRPVFRCQEIELARVLAHQAMLAIQLMRLSAQSRHTAVLAERHRMARELHDTLAQGITSVIVQLEAAEDATARGLPEAVDQHLKRARELARQTLREARRSVRAMRPQALKDQDLCQALSALLKQMTEGSGTQAEFVLKGTPRKLPTKCEENILRIGQEVLTNALRHAAASSFVARLAFSPQWVRLHLHDNGQGFDPDGTYDGFGLTGIRERVESMGGHLAIRSSGGKGTSISIHLGASSVSHLVNS